MRLLLQEHRTALHLAAMKGHGEVVRALLRHDGTVRDIRDKVCGLRELRPYVTSTVNRSLATAQQTAIKLTLPHATVLERRVPIVLHVND